MTRPKLRNFRTLVDFKYVRKCFILCRGESSVYKDKPSASLVCLQFHVSVLRNKGYVSTEFLDYKSLSRVVAVAGMYIYWRCAASAMKLSRKSLNHN
jgi:hypothetical protein